MVILHSQSYFRVFVVVWTFCGTAVLIEWIKVNFLFFISVRYKYVERISMYSDWSFLILLSLCTKKNFVSSSAGFEPATSGSEVLCAIHWVLIFPVWNFCNFVLIVCQKFLLSSSEGIETSTFCVELLSALHCATGTCIRTRLWLTFSSFHQTRISCTLNLILELLFLSELFVVLRYYWSEPMLIFFIFFK